ncbi:hypothetical protein V6N11_010320 [Hibiscus sabdariffa]|uniref:Uncharacterized protein n=1 Tax=Hibiscus sabdariffa TaxID=183260 RepID=A0ABR2PF21_9ROSI
MALRLGNRMGIITSCNLGSFVKGFNLHHPTMALRLGNRMGIIPQARRLDSPSELPLPQPQAPAVPSDPTKTLASCNLGSSVKGLLQIFYRMRLAMAICNDPGSMDGTPVALGALENPKVKNGWWVLSSDGSNDQMHAAAGAVLQSSNYVYVAHRMIDLSPGLDTAQAERYIDFKAVKWYQSEVE